MRCIRPVFFLLLIALVFAAPGCNSGSEEEVTGATAESQELIAAYLGDEPITQEEVDNTIISVLAKARQNMYDQRRAALEQIVANKLAAAEASSRGITTQEFYEAEVISQIGDASDEEVKEFYEKNKARIKEFQTMPYEQLVGPIRNNIKQMKANAVRDEMIAQLKKRAGFRLIMEPPRAEVTVPDGEPTRGAADAVVTIVEFSDYECGYCKRAHPVVEKIMAEFGDRVRFVYRDYPLDNLHPKARPAAVAARCAGDQEKYWDYNKHIMENAGSLDRTNLVTRAEALGLDMNLFNTCLDSGKYDAAIETALVDGAALGVTGTPTFFINGRMMVGIAPYELMKTIIEEELARNSES
jgi:protein-disulfide isomerase